MVGEGFSVCSGDIKQSLLVFRVVYGLGFILLALVSLRLIVQVFSAQADCQTVFRVMDTSNVQPIGNTDLSR